MKIMLSIISCLIIMSYSVYSIKEHNKKELVKSCLSSKDEAKILSCIELRSYFTIQEYYNLFYNTYNYKNSKHLEMFYKNYELAFGDCKGTKNCDLHDKDRLKIAEINFKSLNK